MDCVIPKTEAWNDDWKKGVKKEGWKKTGEVESRKHEKTKRKVRTDEGANSKEGNGEK